MNLTAPFLFSLWEKSRSSTGTSGHRAGNETRKKSETAHRTRACEVATTGTLDRPRRPLNAACLVIALALAVSVAAPAQDRSPALSPGELISAVAANEMADRLLQWKWMYVIEKQDGMQTITKAQVDSTSGPLYRVLAIDGKPLNPNQQRQDNARLDRLLHDPSQQLKSKRAHDEDELKLQELMRVMPDAFLYDYDGLDGDLVRLTFRPKPQYNPPTYEARVVHNLAGTILIDPNQKRLVKLSGKLINRVDFGYGLLGHIDKGGTVEIARVEVGSTQWKTRLIDIQMSGRLVFFKTVSKQQHETRSDFRQVPSDLSLSDANALLLSPSVLRASY